MLSVQKKTCLLDYCKCNQTVTVYHQGTDKTIARTVYENAYLDFQKNQNVNKTGSSESNSFLLVIPGESVILYNGDKVLLGEGPESVTWTEFIPAKVPGLVVIKHVDPKYWNGVQCHVEAGG
ncbi:MAG: hypothetical protein H6Q60_1162 [Oscillospiraceae bacterium]|nr:hypothetical protein [Oscillospiraceae bacterium]